MLERHRQNRPGASRVADGLLLLSCTILLIAVAAVVLKLDASASGGASRREAETAAVPAVVLPVPKLETTAPESPPTERQQPAAPGAQAALSEASTPSPAGEACAGGGPCADEPASAALFVPEDAGGPTADETSAAPAHSFEQAVRGSEEGIGPPTAPRDPAGPVAVAPARPARAAQPDAFVVQFGAYIHEALAAETAETLRRAGIEAVVVPGFHRGGRIYRVHSATMPERERARAVAAQADALGIATLIIGVAAGQ